MKKKILTFLLVLIVLAIIISVGWVVSEFMLYLATDHTFNFWSIRTFFISIAALFLSMGLTYMLNGNEPVVQSKETSKPTNIIKTSKFQQRLEETQREKNKKKHK